MNAIRVCDACGAEIPRNPKWRKEYYATRRFCDKDCQLSLTPGIALDYEVTADGCWEWRGYIDRNGYGRGYDHEAPRGERSDWAHRLSYRRNVGPIPAGMEIDHMCENPPCMNPEHLQMLTRQEHIQVTIERAGGFLNQETAALLRARGLTYAEIADALEMSSLNSAWAMVQRAIANGLVSPDSLPQRRLLDESDRNDIRALYQLGIPQTEIANWYDMDSSAISRICRGFTSGHEKRNA